MAEGDQENKPFEQIISYKIRKDRKPTGFVYLLPGVPMSGIKKDKADNKEGDQEKDQLEIKKKKREHIDIGFKVEGIVNHVIVDRRCPAHHPQEGQDNIIKRDGDSGNRQKIPRRVLDHLHQSKISIFFIGNHFPILVKAEDASQVPAAALVVKWL